MKAMLKWETNMLNYLKIKVVSLAAEARLIRKDEHKQLKWARFCKNFSTNTNALKHSDYHYRVFFGLQQHRKLDVRSESRHSNIAYGFLKGRKYSQIEKVQHNKNTNPPSWDRVWNLVRKFGEGSSDELRDRFVEWKSAE